MGQAVSSKLIIGIVVVALLGGLTTAVGLTLKQDQYLEPPVVAPAPTPAPPAPEPPASQPPSQPRPPELPGLLMVSIGNNRSARPQSGLEHADIVYELLAEGGITRLLALFYSRSAPEVGPVRSLRLAQLEIAMGYGGAFAHAGGNLDALNLIRELKPCSLDEIYGSGAYFWRLTTRKPPDNLYTSTDRLLEAARAKGYQLQELAPLPAGEPGPGDPAQEVVVAFARLVNAPNIVRYEFDGEVYHRQINAEPHTTANGVQLGPANLLFLETETVQVMKEELQLDITVTGQGRALLVRGGQAYAGTWSKSGREQPFAFRSGNGDLLVFAPGQVWIHLVPDLKLVEYR